MALEWPQIGSAAQSQDVCKFRAGIPAQQKAELLHEIRGFLRDKGIVGWATYGCIEVSSCNEDDRHAACAKDVYTVEWELRFM